jgi:rare lipoprotein A
MFSPQAVFRFGMSCCAVLLLTSCSFRQAVQEPLPSSTIQPPHTKETTAWISEYGDGDGFNGRKTASGEIFRSDELTAAHRTLPFGTMLKLTNPKNNKSVVVRVNDRGPYAKGRTLDVSARAAHALGMGDKGVLKVKMEKVTEEARNQDEKIINQKADAR